MNKEKERLKSILLTLILINFLFLNGCDNNKNNTTQQKPSPSIATVNVKVFEPQPLNFTLKISLPGRIIASRTAEIRPQVNGIILKKYFEEGNNVKEGQSLYQIDPSIYQANYDKALATLASSEASSKMAKSTLRRNQDLFSKKSISQQDYDKAVAEYQQAMASELSAQASLQSAKVSLDYTKVYSPINGYIGKSNVTEGALVSTNLTNPMAIVRQIDTIYVDMTQSASEFSQFNKDKNKIYKSEPKIALFFNDGNKYPIDGEIVFSDRNVSESTGTVTIRASFANPNSELLPGMFVKPLITLGTIEDAVLIPQKGITSDSFGNYTAIVAVPVNENEEMEVLTKAFLAKNFIQYDKNNQDSYNQAALSVKSEIEKIIKQKKESKSPDKRFYYFEKRNNIQVYKSVPGYWVIKNGIKKGEKVIVTGLLNLSGVGSQISDNKIFANVIENPGKLTQEELNKIIEKNVQ